MLWLTAISIIGVTGLLFAVLGWRGAYVDDHPWCRRCGYDLVGSAAIPGRCPECGVDLMRRRAVRHGRRRRRPVMTAAGAVPAGMALALVVVVAVQGWRGYNWNRAKPIWMLVREARSGDAASDRALTQLLNRLGRGDVAEPLLETLAAEALAIQADRTRPWFGGWGDLVEVARDVGVLSADQWAQYARNAVWVSLDVRTPIGPADPLMRRLIVHERVGTGRRLAFSAELVSTRIDGRHLDLAYGPAARLIGWGWRRREVSLLKNVLDFTPRDVPPLPMSPGRHVLETEWRLVIKDNNVSPRQPEVRGIDGWLGWLHGEDDVLVEWVVSLTADIERFPAGEDPIELVHDGSLAPAVERSIRVMRCGIYRGRSGGRVEFGDLPVDCAFEVFWRAGDREWFAGVVSSEDIRSAQGAPASGFGGEPMAGFELQPVTVVLRPSRDVAARTFHIRRLWGEEVVIENVLVSEINLRARSGE